MSRVLLVRQKGSPSRTELRTTDRAIGDLFFANLGLDFAGYIVAEGMCKLAAQWMIEEDNVENVLAHVRTKLLEGYDAQVYRRARHFNGSQQEVRVF